MRIGILTILALAACAPAGPTFTAADEAAIMAERQAFEDAVNRADWDRASALFADDAVLMQTGSPAVRGRLAIRERFNSFPANAEIALYGEELIGEGNLAVVRGALSILMVPPGSSVAVADTTKYVEVWRRQADGAWKVIWDIGNSDRAP